MADIEQYQVTGWNAAVFAADHSLEAALAIIHHMELSEDNCDPSDWDRLTMQFGGVDALKRRIYEHKEPASKCESCGDIYAEIALISSDDRLLCSECHTDYVEENEPE